MNTKSFTDLNQLPFDRVALEQYLSTLYRTDVRICAVHEFESDETEADLKEFGYGHPLFIEFVRGDAEQTEQVVFHTMAADQFGHERRSDRARHLLLDHETFNALPRHVPSLDVGAIGADGTLISLGAAGEFFHLSQYVPGELYAHDLPRIAAADRAAAADAKRVRILADYLAQIHAHRKTDVALYRRRIRDLLGDGEGIMGMLDSYPADFALAPPFRLQTIEEHCYDLYARDYFAHVTPEGLRPSDRALDAGFCHRFVGENLAAGQPTLERVMTAWEESPAHNTNMLEPDYVYVGMARYVAPNGRIFWGQLMAFHVDE